MPSTARVQPRCSARPDRRRKRAEGAAHARHPVVSQAAEYAPAPRGQSGSMQAMIAVGHVYAERAG